MGPQAAPNPGAPPAPLSPRALSRVLGSTALGLALMLAPAAARSDQPTPAPSPPARDTAAADSLFQAARTLMEQQRFAEACPKFAESLRLDPTIGTRLNLARCHEAEGKIATAWAEYREVVDLARAAGQKERADTAAELAAKLDAEVPKLRIDAPSAAAGLSIKRDGVVVGTAALGTLIAVDPGEHTIVASAPGHLDWTTTVAMARASGQKVITVPALQPAGSPGGDSSPSSPLRTVGLVVGGVGILALGAGAVFGGLTLADAGQARSDPALCPDGVCTPAGRTFVDDAQTKALVSNVALIAGGVLAAGGVALFVVSLRKPAEGSPAATPAGAVRRSPARTTGTLQLVPTTGGAVLRGTF